MRIRIGNDITIRWDIYRYNDGLISENTTGSIAEDLTNAINLTVKLGIYGKGIVSTLTEVVVDVNLLTVHVPKELTPQVGKYYVILDYDKTNIELDDELQHYRLDSYAFDLVSYTASADAVTDIAIESQLVAGIDGINGLSAYELAVHYEGFTGTVEEYLTSLRQPAIEAKEEVDVALVGYEELKKELEDGEEARIYNEQLRVAAETARTSAETTRVSNETARVEAEEVRESAEASRVDAETARESAEDNRTTAEASRVTAETARAGAETTRESAESQRVANENTRGENEGSRVVAETERVASEENRVSAESARGINEGTRVAAETARAGAEVTRVNNETNRVAAEQSRVAFFDTVSGEITELRSDLNEIISSTSVIRLDQTDDKYDARYKRIKRLAAGQLPQEAVNLDQLLDRVEISGIATPSTIPVKTRGMVAYLASQNGIYTGFNNAVISDSLNFLIYNGNTGSVQNYKLLPFNNQGIGSIQGKAIPTTSPVSTPDKCVYFASMNGVYTNFDNIEVTTGVAILYRNDTKWYKLELGDSINAALSNDSIENDIDLPSILNVKATRSGSLSDEIRFIDFTIQTNTYVDGFNFEVLSSQFSKLIEIAIYKSNGDRVVSTGQREVGSAGKKYYCIKTTKLIPGDYKLAFVTNATINFKLNHFVDVETSPNQIPLPSTKPSTTASTLFPAISIHKYAEDEEPDFEFEYLTDIRVLGRNPATNTPWGWNTATGKLCYSVSSGATWIDVMNIAPSDWSPVDLLVDETNQKIFVWGFGAVLWMSSDLTPSATWTKLVIPNLDANATGRPYGIELWNGYLWVGEYSGKPELTGGPRIHRYDIVGDSWIVSKQFPNCRHIHSFHVAGSDLLYVQTGDANYGEDLALWRLPKANISTNTWQKVTSITPPNTDHYPINMVIDKIGRIIGGSDRPGSHLLSVNPTLNLGQANWNQLLYNKSDSGVGETVSAIHIDNNGDLIYFTGEDLTIPSVYISPYPYIKSFRIKDLSDHPGTIVHGRTVKAGEYWMNYKKRIRMKGWKLKI